VESFLQAQCQDDCGGETVYQNLGGDQGMVGGVGPLYAKGISEVKVESQGEWTGTHSWG